MDTHINGVCPTHIYEKRRPIESKNTYALEYRKDNFKPVTMQEFAKAINGVIAATEKGIITVKKDDTVPTLEYNGVKLTDYVKTECIRDREKDPNSIMVLIPTVSEITDGVVNVDKWGVYVVGSDDIIEIEKDESVKVKYEGYEYLLINKSGIFLGIEQDGVKIEKSLIEYSIDVSPYINISNLDSKICVDIKKKEYVVEIKDAYFSGAAAWGDKYYAQESDLMISSVNNTYIKEIRYKRKCDELGMIFDNGIHCDSVTKEVCKSCKGSGYISGDSPLNVIEVSYEDNTDGLPEVVKWSEPPQNAIKTSMEMCDSYYSKMCDSLGLVSQNMTNQSGISKAFDYQSKIDTINVIFLDSVRIVKEAYQILKSIIDINKIYDINVLYVFNVDTISSSEGKIKKAKAESMPTFLQEKIYDSIYIEALGDSIETATVLKWAKKFDKLYTYNNEEIATARAMFGTISERDIMIHNSIIRELIEYYINNDIESDPTEYINTIYPTPANNAILV